MITPDNSNKISAKCIDTVSFSNDNEEINKSYQYMLYIDLFQIIKSIFKINGLKIQIKLC